MIADKKLKQENEREQVLNALQEKSTVYTKI